MATRLVIWIVTAIVVGYDIVCVALGWPTISNTIRLMDQESGQLIRWAWLGLWFHFFIIMPDAGKFYPPTHL